MDHTVAMQRAITLANCGLGKTSPNPIVGALIIDSAGSVISEGFHDRMASTDHAEIVALNGAGSKARGATIVVTLEPCAHTGKTGPCTQAIIDAGISTVVFAVRDPSHLASGGAAILRAAGCHRCRRRYSGKAAHHSTGSAAMWPISGWTAPSGMGIHPGGGCKVHEQGRQVGAASSGSDER